MNDDFHALALVHSFGYFAIAFTLMELFGNDLTTVHQIIPFAPVIIIIVIAFVDDIKEAKGDNDEK